MLGIVVLSHVLLKPCNNLRSTLALTVLNEVVGDLFDHCWVEISTFRIRSDVVDEER
jgi:hypothetical protein